MSVRTIAVTGTSRGIGAGLALELARRGFLVGCLSRGGGYPDGHADVAKELKDRLIPITCDTTDDNLLAEAFRALAAKTGGIDGLINNAGIHREAKAALITNAEFEAVMSTNATAVLAACREVYPHLKDRGRGMIVNIGSFFDKLGTKGSIAYAASKAAVGAITRGLAAEWGRDNISVVMLAPGYIETDINRAYLADPNTGKFVRTRTFTGRAGRVDEVARLVAALIAEDISFLTGETIYLDGGQGVAL
jgi:NAD(P)-dependent dehydrogenase (short-subunit alcohol dehydrogenase family)